MRRPGWIIIAAAGVVVVLLVVVLAVSLWYVDGAWHRLPPAETHAEVRSVLKHFRERQVDLSDIPVEWREGLSSVPSHEVYRYDFLGCSLLPIHVVYDEDGQVVQIVPTYE